MGGRWLVWERRFTLNVLTSLVLWSRKVQPSRLFVLKKHAHCDCQPKSLPCDPEKSATRARSSQTPTTSSSMIVENRPPGDRAAVISRHPSHRLANVSCVRRFAGLPLETLAKAVTVTLQEQDV